MVYLFLITFIVSYSYIIRERENKNSFYLYLITIITLLIITIGLQENVGTDYKGYLGLADGSESMEWMKRKGEILFVLLVSFVKKTNNPQLIFIIAATIQVLFLILIFFEIKKLNFKMHHFWFLYFTLSLTFFNQFNGIRQYIAVYMVVYAILKLLNDKYLSFICLIIIANLFHSSAIYFLIFIFIKRLLNKKYKIETIFLLIFGLLILSSINTEKYIEILLSYTSYKSYIGSSYLSRMSIQGIITKIPKLIIVLFSSYLIYRDDLNNKEINLLNLGYLGCVVLILSFSSSIIWRFYQYLDLFIIFPVLILFNDEKYKTYKILISLALFIMLLIKIIVIPRGEYLYNSILF